MKTFTVTVTPSGYGWTVPSQGATGQVAFSGATVSSSGTASGYPPQQQLAASFPGPSSFPVTVSVPDSVAAGTAVNVEIDYGVKYDSTNGWASYTGSANVPVAPPAPTPPVVTTNPDPTPPGGVDVNVTSGNNTTGVIIQTGPTANGPWTTISTITSSGTVFIPGGKFYQIIPYNGATAGGTVGPYQAAPPPAALSNQRRGIVRHSRFRR